MICIEYCPNCPDNGNANLCVTANAHCSSPAVTVHHHDDPVTNPPINCIHLESINETQPTSYPHVATDTTVINNEQEWLNHLQTEYVP